MVMDYARAFARNGQHWDKHKHGVRRIDIGDVLTNIKLTKNECNALLVRYWQDFVFVDTKKRIANGVNKNIITELLSGGGVKTDVRDVDVTKAQHRGVVYQFGEAHLVFAERYDFASCLYLETHGNAGALAAWYAMDFVMGGDLRVIESDFASILFFLKNKAQADLLLLENPDLLGQIAGFLSPLSVSYSITGQSVASRSLVLLSMLIDSDDEDLRAQFSPHAAHVV